MAEQTAAQKRKTRDRQTEADALQAVSRHVGKVAPQEVELEEAILGAIMIEKNAILSVQDVLVAESFYHDAHQLIFAAALELSAALHPVDLHTVSIQLKKSGHLAAIGGTAYLTGLTQKVGSAAHLEFHAKIVAQKYVQRQLIAASTAIQKNSFSDEFDVEELVNQAEQAIFQIAEGNIRRDVQASKDVVAKAMKMIEAAASKPDGMSGVPSGFAELDRMTLGWQPSDLVIIAARPSMGKTAFVLSLARNIVMDYKRAVAFFSLEMSSVQLMTRLLIGESQIASEQIKSGRLSPDEWKTLETAAKPLAMAPLYIDDTPALSIFEFRSKARRLKMNSKVEIIIIDYLQLMTASTAETRGNREQEVALISRSLKAIAKELDVPILALSQLNRSVESRGGTKRPQLSDLRESGAIEQDADIVSFIHRPEYYGMTEAEDGTPTAGLAEIIVAKHRNGAVDTVKLRFIKEQAKFVDWSDTGFTNISGPKAVGYTNITSAGFDNEEGLDALSASQGNVVMASNDGFDSEAPF